MKPTLTIPTPELAIERVLEIARELQVALLDVAERQFAADDELDQRVNSIIGSPNPMTGKPHSASSAETLVKNQEPWREARRDVLRAEGQVEHLKAELHRAKLVARLAVLAVEHRAAA